MTISIAARPRAYTALTYRAYTALSEPLAVNRHRTSPHGTGGPTAALAGNGVTTPTPSPDLQLSGKKKQHPTIGPGPGCGGVHTPDPVCGPCDMRADCAVKVKASCGADACTARAEGKLTKGKNDKLDGARGIDVRPHETRTLHLRLTTKMREKALKAIDKGTSRRRSPSARRMRPATWRPRSAPSPSSSRSD